MNHYQISGIIILVLVAALATFTFWPVNQVPSIEVTFPTTDIATTTADKPAAPSTAGTKPKPQTTTPASPGAGARTFEKGFYVTTIHYTDQGFVPEKVEVNNGEEVRFVNKTSSAMHVQAESQTSSQYYRAINQPNTVFKGGTYQLQVPEVGVFNYFNINTNPKKSGQVIVK